MDSLEILLSLLQLIQEKEQVQKSQMEREMGYNQVAALFLPLCLRADEVILRVRLGFSGLTLMKINKFNQKSKISKLKKRRNNEI